MSQKVTRKSTINEDKEKKQTDKTDTPAKDMKKKMAANAEKEKQAAEKSEKSKSEVTEKPTEKTAEKNVDKDEKKTDKTTEKKDAPAERQKKEEESSSSTGKGEKSGKTEKPEKDKPKQNGNSKVHNGVSDVTLSTNGGTEELNGTVSADSDDDDVMLVIDDDDHDQDELFPELTYDDTSDVECFESPTPESVPSRSLTRRSQVKATRTPETPRPASDKQADKDTNDDPKDSKVLKLKEEAPPSSDRKLRSADSPKRQEVKKTLDQTKKSESSQDSPKKDQEKSEEAAKGNEEEKKAEESAKSAEKVKEGDSKEEKMPEPTVTIIEVVQDSGEDKSAKPQEEKSGENAEKIETEVIVEVEVDEEPRKTDTNYSKSRVKVSPYRRSMRIADQTSTSMMANYTGNNTTMEMDITETSSFVSDDGASLDDSSYLRGLRTIRGRSSYKPLKEITLKHVANRSARSVNTSVDTPRPTGTVVGRKRKPDSERDDAPEPTSAEPGDAVSHAHTKRMRLLDRISMPFRRTVPMHMPRRPAEIVGINTDLPLTAPVTPRETFDPETLKPAATPHIPTVTPQEPIATPLSHDERDSKRCIVM